MTDVYEELQSAIKVLRVAEQAVREHRALKTIRCRACANYHAIKDMRLIVTHWYVSPYGCSGGDYWDEGEWHAVCPTTETRNRLLFNDRYEDRKTIGKGAEVTFKHIYRGLFKESQNEYKDGPPSHSVNNYDVDTRAVYFCYPLLENKG